MVWGGWKGHEPKKCIDMFAPWAEAEGAKTAGLCLTMIGQK